MSGPIKDPISVSERPPRLPYEQYLSHWEGDLIEKKKDTFIVTLIERTTRYVILAQIRSKVPSEVVNERTRQMRKITQTLTLDCGSELHAHKQVSVADVVQVTSCDPASTWQRETSKKIMSCSDKFFRKDRICLDHAHTKLDIVVGLETSLSVMRQFRF